MQTLMSDRDTWRGIVYYPGCICQVVVVVVVLPILLLIIIPIPKSSPPTIEDVRPIALTDHFAKIAEHFVAKRSTIAMNPSIDLKQFGNVKGSSTSHCLIDVLHCLLLHAEEPRLKSTMLLADFMKAFDHIDHTTAIRKLIVSGVDGSLVLWISDFLSNRQHRVVYAN